MRMEEYQCKAQSSLYSQRLPVQFVSSPKKKLCRQKAVSSSMNVQTATQDYVPKLEIVVFFARMEAPFARPSRLNRGDRTTRISE